MTHYRIMSHQYGGRTHYTVQKWVKPWFRTSRWMTIQDYETEVGSFDKLFDSIGDAEAFITPPTVSIVKSIKIQE